MVCSWISEKRIFGKQFLGFCVNSPHQLLWQWGQLWLNPVHTLDLPWQHISSRSQMPWWWEAVMVLIMLTYQIILCFMKNWIFMEITLWNLIIMITNKKDNFWENEAFAKVKSKINPKTHCSLIQVTCNLVTVLRC